MSMESNPNQFILDQEIFLQDDEINYSKFIFVGKEERGNIYAFLRTRKEIIKVRTNLIFSKEEYLNILKSKMDKTIDILMIIKNKIEDIKNVD